MYPFSYWIVVSSIPKISFLCAPSKSLSPPSALNAIKFTVVDELKAGKSDAIKVWSKEIGKPKI